jgi:hypothetical protein
MCYDNCETVLEGSSSLDGLELKVPRMQTRVLSQSGPFPLSSQNNHRSENKVRRTRRNGGVWYKTLILS